MPSVTFQPTAQGYSGDIAQGFLTKLIFGAQTVQRGLVFVDDGIKPKRLIRRITATGVLQKYKITPVTADSKGDITLSGRELEPKKCMVYKELDPTEWEDDWLAAQQTEELIDLRLPATGESYITQEIFRSASKDLEIGLWQNDASDAGDILGFDGFIPKLLTVGAGTRISAGAVALTVGNIISKLEQAYGETDPVVRRDSMFKIVINPNTEELWRKALVALTNKGVGPESGAFTTMAGKKLEVLDGIPDNTIITGLFGNTRDSNFRLGTKTKGSSGPSNEQPSVKFMPLQNNSEMWFLKAIYALDVQVGWPEEVVLYTV